MEQSKNEMKVSLSRRALLRGMAGGALALGAGQALSGCNGSSNGGLNNIGRLVFGPDAVKIDLATGAASPVKLGRGFARLGTNNQVLEIGFELEDGALGALPPTPYNVPTVFNAGLPAEAIAGSLFRQIGLSYWTGHDPPGIGEAPHFHAVFLFQPVQPFNPAFPELIPVAANEVPTGFIDGRNVPTAVVPGVGNGFEDPTLPHMNPHWYGLTYNYFYFGGHLNGVGTGATTDFIKTTQQQSFNLAQPQVYPKAGQYPTKVSSVANTARKSRFFIFSDFRAATQVVTPLTAKTAKAAK